MLNVRCSITAMMRLIRHGECVPVSPLALTTLCHLVQPLHYEQWMDFDFGLIENCDALVRISAEHEEYLQEYSPGADREVEFASSKGIPVFFSLDDLEEWLEA